MDSICTCGHVCSCKCGCSALQGCLCCPKKCKCDCPCADKEVPFIGIASNPLAIIAKRVLAKGKQNPELAKLIANMITDYVGSEMEIQRGYDLSDLGAHGRSDSSVSFSIRPASFGGKNGKDRINGSILITVDFDSPVEGSGPSIANLEVNADVKVGFTFKTPKSRGLGQCMKPAGEGKWEKGSFSIGSSEIIFDEDGSPMFVDESIFDKIAQAIKELSETVLENPPTGAKSYKKSDDPTETRIKNDQHENARQEQYQQEREKDQAEKSKADRSVMESSHGSPDAFKQYLDDNEEDSFGKADVDEITKFYGKNPDDRKKMFDPIKDKLVEMGLKWNPGKPKTASEMTPGRLCIALLEIADYIDSCDEVDPDVIADRLSTLATR